MHFYFEMACKDAKCFARFYNLREFVCHLHTEALCHWFRIHIYIVHFHRMMHLSLGLKILWAKKPKLYFSIYWKINVMIMFIIINFIRIHFCLKWWIRIFCVNENVWAMHLKRYLTIHQMIVSFSHWMTILICIGTRLYNGMQSILPYVSMWKNFYNGQYLKYLLPPFIQKQNITCKTPLSNF